MESQGNSRRLYIGYSLHFIVVWNRYIFIKPTKLCHINGLRHGRRNSSSLAMELCPSSTNPSILWYGTVHTHLSFHQPISLLLSIAFTTCWIDLNFTVLLLSLIYDTSNGPCNLNMHILTILPSTIYWGKALKLWIRLCTWCVISLELWVLWYSENSVFNKCLTHFINCNGLKFFQWPLLLS